MNTSTTEPSPLLLLTADEPMNERGKFDRCCGSAIVSIWSTILHSVLWEYCTMEWRSSNSKVGGWRRRRIAVMWCCMGIFKSAFWWSSAGHSRSVAACDRNRNFPQLSQWPIDGPLGISLSAAHLLIYVLLRLRRCPIDKYSVVCPDQQCAAISTNTPLCMGLRGKIIEEGAIRWREKETQTNDDDDMTMTQPRRGAGSWITRDRRA